MTGADLKAARQALGLTQAELAQAVGLSWSSIARYEMPANEGRYPVPRWLSLVVRMWLKEAVTESNKTIST